MGDLLLYLGFIYDLLLFKVRRKGFCQATSDGRF